MTQALIPVLVWIRHKHMCSQADVAATQKLGAKMTPHASLDGVAMTPCCRLAGF